jgi:hypothetical protein
MKNILFLLLIVYLPSVAQKKSRSDKDTEPKKIKSLEVSDTIISASVDRPGDLYIITRYGQFQKFDQDGKLAVLYKSEMVPTLFDPRDGSRLFAYYRDVQQYDYMRPSFEITNSFRIDSAFAIQPWLMCTSGDSKLWVLDRADNSLKKLNTSSHDVEIEVNIDSTVINDASVFTTMREYQNFVFLLNPHKGIDVFNSIGQHIKTIEVKGLHTFHFLGEELYYQKGGVLKFFNLFTAQTRETSQGLLKGDIILTDQRMFVIHHRNIDIYEVKP